MRYLLLVYGARVAAADPAGRALVASHVVEDAVAATCVRVRGGQTLVTDGPYAETEEELRLVDVIDVPSLDEAIAVAERIPAAHEGVVEIRPVVRQAEAAA